MPPLDYLVLRRIRRHLPDRAIRALLGRGLIIRPGLETRSPHAATRRFWTRSSRRERPLPAGG